MPTMLVEPKPKRRSPQWRKLLQSGDQVTWTDPDQGLCSRTLTISDISYLPGGLVQITDQYGGFVLAHFNELS